MFTPLADSKHVCDLKRLPDNRYKNNICILPIEPGCKACTSESPNVWGAAKVVYGTTHSQMFAINLVSTEPLQRMKMMSRATKQDQSCNVPYFSFSFLYTVRWLICFLIPVNLANCKAVKPSYSSCISCLFFFKKIIINIDEMMMYL